MTRKTQNSCRHFRAVPSSHTERAPISSSFIVSVPSHSPPQYTELSRTVLNLQLIVLTIQPATTQGLPLVGGSSCVGRSSWTKADVCSARRQRGPHRNCSVGGGASGNPKAPPPCARAGVRGWSPRAFEFHSADASKVPSAGRRRQLFRPLGVAAVTPNHLPTPGLPWSRMTAGGCVVANRGRPPAFSFQSQGRSRSSVCAARRALQGGV